MRWVKCSEKRFYRAVDGLKYKAHEPARALTHALIRYFFVLFLPGCGVLLSVMFQHVEYQL